MPQCVIATMDGGATTTEAAKIDSSLGISGRRGELAASNGFLRFSPQISGENQQEKRKKNGESLSCRSCFLWCAAGLDESGRPLVRGGPE